MATFKVGDRVIARDERDPNPGTVTTRNSQGVMSILWDGNDEPGIEWWEDHELASAHSQEDAFAPPPATAPAPTSYPDDNPKTAIGVTKPALHVIPPVALLHLGKAMADGKRKYGLMNWREKRVSSSVYYDAALRHLLSWFDGEEVAQDSGVHHLAHAMACMGILLDAQATGNLNDDRPIPGPAADFIKANINAAA